MINVVQNKVVHFYLIRVSFVLTPQAANIIFLIPVAYEFVFSLNVCGSV